MANLSITRRCARGCDFCFASAERGRMPLDMSAEMFGRALDFLERSGVPDARLLGGEPTLHPAFGVLAQRALDRGFALTVMTGGLVPAAELAYLASMPDGRVSVYLNAARPTDDESLVAAQRAVCAALGPRVELGLTLRSADDDPAFLLGLIAEHDLRPSVRLGIAHPAIGAANRAVPDAELRATGATMERFVERAEKAGVSVGFDCGVTPCLFSAAFRARRPALAETLGTRCAPIVDVLPEGAAVACYALAPAARLPLGDSDTRAEVVRRLDGALAGLPVGVFPECDACAHRAAGHCTGGCRARAVIARPTAVTAALGEA